MQHIRWVKRRWKYKHVITLVTMPTERESDTVKTSDMAKVFRL